MTRSIMFIAVAAMALTTSTIARADAVGAGTVSSSHNFVPTVVTASDPGTYGAFSGATFQTSGTGAFADAAIALGVAGEDFDGWVKPADMTKPLAG